MKKSILTLVWLFVMAPLMAFGGPVTVDSTIPRYTKPATPVSGTLKSVGSDTMNNLMTLWGEEFQKFHPGVKIEIEGKGSSTAPPALIEGASTFGPMSREMKPTEIESFEKKFGYKPTALATSLDMLAVYVNKDNPVKGFSFTDLDAIFSKTRKNGASEDVRTWGQLSSALGIPAAYSDKPISIYGRNSASGTYGYFKEHVLANGDFKDSVKEQPGSASVVQGITNDKFGIGYSGIGFKTADVRAVPLTKKAGEKFVPAEAKNAYTGVYPLARPLLIYVNAQPGKELDPLRKEFIRLVFSREGQEAVIRDGYLPVTAAMAAKALQAAGIPNRQAISKN